MHTEAPRPTPASLYAAVLFILTAAALAVFLPQPVGAGSDTSELPASTLPVGEWGTDPVAE